ncbi:hypothetical protein ABW20_dc0104529 [Dactylellina cionopaga]|nr:hypothetical protein ABW20_dc0104529 [Dactylellina cionopaga]
MLRFIVSTLLVLGAAAVPSARFAVRQSSSTITVTGTDIATGTTLQIVDVDGTNYIGLAQSGPSSFSYDATSQQLSAIDDTNTDVFSQTFFNLDSVYDDTPSPVSFKTESDMTDCIGTNLCRYEVWTLTDTALGVARTSQPKLYACSDGDQTLLWVGPNGWTLCTPVTLALS